MADKTQEQRIEDAAKKLIVRFPDSHCWNSTAYDVAREVLEAADAPRKPAWPSKESRRAFYEAAHGMYVSFDNDVMPSRIDDGLRAAFEADPIIQAAVELVNGNFRIARPPRSALTRREQGLVDAVDEAGL